MLKFGEIYGKTFSGDIEKRLNKLAKDTLAEQINSKIKPTEELKKTLYFSKEYVSEIKSEIKTGKNLALKSRRNKKFLSGNSIYKSYISENSENLVIIQEIITQIAQKSIKISEKLNFCAVGKSHLI